MARVLRHMASASNKPFDYLAWARCDRFRTRRNGAKCSWLRAMELACDPGDVNSVAEVMGWCVKQPAKVRAMVKAGRKRIMGEWNYERQFEGEGIHSFNEP